MNLEKEIWEGWTVQNFIDDIDFAIDSAFKAGNIRNREELKRCCIDNQPYYKKYIPEVVEYFSKKYNIE